jgi:hypothetical protein
MNADTNSGKHGAIPTFWMASIEDYHRALLSWPVSQDAGQGGRAHDWLRNDANRRPDAPGADTPGP